MSFPRYPAYKPSGVEWLGEVPEHWNALPLRRLISEVSSGTSVNAIDEPASPGQPGVLKTSCVYTGEFRPEENKAILESELERASCPVVAGSLIVSRMNTPDLVGAAGLVKYDDPFLFLPDRLWQVTFQDCNPQFMNFWCKSVSYRSQVQLACSGTSSSMQNLSQDNFYSFIAPLPSKTEQLVIASFLDRETAKIDALIAEKQRLIELLQEKRQAVISHAVTKGLNPDAPMKHSGVEWLGEVPEHWIVASLRRYIRIAEGQVDPRLEPYSAMTLIAPNHIESGTGLLTSLETAGEQGAESGKYLCDLGDVTYSKIRPALRKACIAPETCLTSADMYPLKAMTGMSNEFLLNFLLSPQFSALAMVESERVAMPKINRDALLAVSVAVLPLSEQHEICSHVKQLTTHIDQLSVEVSSSIRVMNERRSALISSAVTGQIDVRGLVEAEGS